MGKASNTRVALLAASVVVAMMGASYAAVPLYKAFCRATGFGGTPQRATRAPDEATNQDIVIRFDANTSSGLTWNFRPRQTEMTIKVGAQAVAYFDATNFGSKELTGAVFFNVTPPQAGAYFKKIQCFCFTRQTLKSGQSAEFPVVYFIDPAILKDADAKGIQEITLSYTFYPAEALPATAKQAALQTN